MPRGRSDRSKAAWVGPSLLWTLPVCAAIALVGGCAAGVDGEGGGRTSRVEEGWAVPLHAPPAGLVAVCRESERRGRSILCPSGFPRRTVRPVSPFVSQQLDFGRWLGGVELGYSAPYVGEPHRNRPDRFLHFVVMVGSGAEAPGSRRGWEPLGSRRFGDRRGRLFYVPVRGVHHEHYLFAWLERGFAYQASLHSWDDPEAAIRLLAALVSSLAPVRELPRDGGASA